MAERAVKLAPTDSSVLHNAVCTYAHAGEIDKAIEMMERRMQAADTIHSDWVDHDPDFDSIRDDPRFKALIAKLPEN